MLCAQIFVEEMNEGRREGLRSLQKKELEGLGLGRKHEIHIAGKRTGALFSIQGPILP